jgi:hypothetical protein
MSSQPAREHEEFDIQLQWTSRQNRLAYANAYSAFKISQARLVSSSVKFYTWTMQAGRHLTRVLLQEACSLHVTMESELVSFF